MLISSCQIKNYKSFKDSEELKFTPGFNVIVGRNNVGKSALIEALSARPGSVPHRSLETAKRANSPVNPQSSVTLTFAIEPEEWARLLWNKGEFFVPNIEGLAPQQTAERFLEFAAKPFNFRCTFAGAEIPSAELLGFGNGYGGEKVSIRYDSTCEEFKFSSPKLSTLGDERTFARRLAEGLRESIYAFRAERLTVGQCRIGANAELLPNAQNLAEVLQLLQSNVTRFRRFNEDVHTVFPEIQQVSVRPIDKENVRVLVWSVDPSTEREDLAVPLNDCGTGIGQVLAMLYVVTNSDSPRTIIIDEPQSFLHPAAIRKLFDIFKRYPQHQFIVSTHSPSAVTAANPKTLILLRREGNETKSEVLNIQEASELRLFLHEIGARLSDVFGADNILWVEGRAEEVCLHTVVEKVMKKELLGTEIIGVLPIGELEERDKDTVLKIHRQLAKGRGLLPPAKALVFDREGRLNKVMDEVERETGGLVRFIPRKKFDCYLLNPKAITAVLNEADKDRPEPLTEKEVEDSLKSKAKKFGYSLAEKDWSTKVEGARLLNEMFSELTKARVTYDRVKHGAKLTEWIAANSPADFDELANFLRPILEKK